MALAARRGVAVLAITDHDTTSGVGAARAAAEAHGVEVVAGVELACENGEARADLLGYIVDPEDAALSRLLADIRLARDARARVMVARLQALGAPIDYDDVAARSGGGSIGRPHVAHALVAMGFVEDVAGAFRDYLGVGAPAYAERYKLSPAEGCRAIRAAGGVPVVAHPVPPGDPRRDPLRLRSFLGPLVASGLGGLECYYPGYTPPVHRWLEALAGHFGLVPTGGSDFHGPWRPENALGSVPVPPDTLDRLRAARAA